MSILHPAVARRKFPALVAKFEEAAPSYDTVWKLRGASFPHLSFDLLNTQGQSCLGLLVNAANWNHRSISVTVMDADFRRYVPDTELALRKDAEGQTHVYVRFPGDRLWFCVPGTDEYHSDHSAGIPWESVRDLPEYDPVLTLQRCIERFDRENLVPIPAKPPAARTDLFQPELQRWVPRGP